MRNINWMYVLICCLLVKIIVFDPSYADALAFVFSLAYLLAEKHLENTKIVKINSEIEEKINNIEKEVVIVKDSVAAVRIGNTFGAVQKKV
jgi:hypothetical protein